MLRQKPLDCPPLSVSRGLPSTFPLVLLCSLLGALSCVHAALPNVPEDAFCFSVSLLPTTKEPTRALTRGRLALSQVYAPSFGG